MRVVDGEMKEREGTDTIIRQDSMQALTCNLSYITLVSVEIDGSTETRMVGMKDERKKVDRPSKSWKKKTWIVNKASA